LPDNPALPDIRYIPIWNGTYRLAALRITCYSHKCTTGH
jgi:hypothetical protein